MTVKNIYPWGNFVIDDATGLPQLPDPGMFFRVCNRLGYEIQIRKKTWYGSRKLGWTVTHLNERSILQDAAYLIRKFNKRTYERHLLGDYPPKYL